MVDGMDLFGKFHTDTGYLGEFLYAGAAHTTDTTKLFEKPLTTLRAKAGDAFQGGVGAAFFAFLPMASDGETVRLVSNLLDQMQRR